MRLISRLAVVGLLAPALALGVPLAATAADSPVDTVTQFDGTSGFVPLKSVVVGSRVVTVAPADSSGTTFGIYSYDKNGGTPVVIGTPGTDEAVLEVFDGKAYFVTHDSGNTTDTLMRTDGTVAGTEVVESLGSEKPVQLSTYGDSLYVAVTGGGTSDVFRFHAGSLDGVAHGPWVITHFGVVGTDLFFSDTHEAYHVDLNDTAAGATGLSTAAGASQLVANDSNVFIGYTDSSSSSQVVVRVALATSTIAFGFAPTAIDPVVFFPTAGIGLDYIAGSSHDRLYYWDGINGSTPHNVATGVAPDGVALSDDATYFFGTSGGQTGLWSTDGVPADNQLISAFDSVHNLTMIGDTLYFYGAEGSSKGLWKSDGTTAGTTFVKSYDSVETIIAFDDTVYFQASTQDGNDTQWDIGRFRAASSTPASDGGDDGDDPAAVDRLPDTGIQPFGLIPLGAAALLIGGAFLVVSRRRTAA